MSFEEKNTWIYLALALIIPAVYASVVFGQLDTTPLDEIAYAGPLLTAIITAIVLSIIGSIVISIGSPKTAGQKDERDVGISRRSDLAGYYFFSGAVVGVLLLVVNNVDHFWIANAIYGAFVLAAIFSSVVKIAAYRRGY
jgi:hypothetical protein